MMLRAALLGLSLLAGVAATSAAQDDLSDGALLERRLGACLTAGAAGAPRESLTSVVVALRSLCHTQIRRVREFRLQAIDESFGLPEQTLTRREQAELDRVRDRTTRALNDEIAVVVSNLTGLTQ